MKPLRFSFFMILVLLGGIAHAGPFTAQQERTFQQTFGDDLTRFRQLVTTVQYQDKDGQRPEDSFHSGDVLIYLQTPPLPGDTDMPLPTAYAGALQGFGHAAIVAKDSEGFYHFDSPMDFLCAGDFHGLKPYVVVRPKKTVFTSPRYEAAVNDLAEKLQAIGFNYDATFYTDVLKWTPEYRAKFRTELMRWHPGDETSPKVPDMYCSELPTTIYALLGIMPTKVITGGDLIDIGVRVEMASGKTKEQIAEGTAQDILGFFKAGFVGAIDDLNSQMSKARRYHARAAVIADLQDSIDQLSGLVEAMKDNERDLKMLLRARMGLSDSGSSNDTRPAGSSVKDLLKKLYFAFHNSQNIVRPVDFLRDALSKAGNFEIVGFYGGNIPSTCGEAPAPAPPVETSDQTKTTP